ncbi:hypothetical protein ACFWNG_23175 [Streptomyces sp. NPDC058391]|uniref:hypothetical protein n=1 Tax=Streptomyces sp. NPDC058391 TaxID=3346476 RepID=UPI0036469DDB
MTSPDDNSAVPDGRFVAALNALGFRDLPDASPVEHAHVLVQVAEILASNAAAQAAGSPGDFTALPDLDGPNKGGLVRDRLVICGWRAARLSTELAHLSTAMRQVVGDDGIGQFWLLAAQGAAALEAALGLLESVSLPEVPPDGAELFHAATTRMAEAGDTASRIRAAVENHQNV